MHSNGAIKDMKIAIIGLGLMGGSILKALKSENDRPRCIVAYDIDLTVLDKVRKKNLADIATDSAVVALNDADLIVIALYPKGAIEFVKTHAHLLKQGAIVTDICGVKRQIDEAIPKLLPKGVHFVGGHPMAGREHMGFDYSVPDLFLGCKYIITDGEKKPVEQIKAFAEILGASKIVVSSPNHHDEMIAYTSQLPHVLSVAYMLQACERGVEDFSAGSFRDLTRVAMINDEMWSELFLANKDKLVDEIAGLRKNLEDFEAMLKDQDRNAMRKKMRKAAEMREGIKG